MTKIEWTDKTWNPVTGCVKISAGCFNCYAEKMAYRLKFMGVDKYLSGFSPAIHTGSLDDPLLWKKPRRIFVCSMSDLFQKDVEDEYINCVMGIINQTERHTYQVLTKRAERMMEYFSEMPVPANLHVGVTVESSAYKSRIDSLRQIDAGIRFLSCEPLLDDLGEVDLTGIHWVIVGGESGPGARRMKPEWVRSLYSQAKERNIPFFFKQWGAWGPDGVLRDKKRNGSLLDGEIVQMVPEEIRS